MAKNEVLVPVARARADTLAAEQIKARILDGTWRPGDRLPSERELATQLAISRGTTREALRILEAIGWLEIKPGEGAIVRDLQRQPDDPLALADLPMPAMKVGDIWEARKLVEPRAAFLAAERYEQAHIRMIEENLRKAESSAEKGDPLEVFTANSGFHLAIARATGNAIIVAFQKLLVRAEHRAVQSRPDDADSTPERGASSLAEHRRIFEAIAIGKPQEAEEAAFDHLISSWMAKWAARGVDRR